MLIDIIRTLYPNSTNLNNSKTTEVPQFTANSLTSDSGFISQANLLRTPRFDETFATSEFEAVRDRITSFVNAGHRSEIIFTKGTTESINLVAYSWGRKFLTSSDEILITEMEHHSNNIPWQLVAKATGAALKFIPVNDDGELENPLSYINKNTKIVAIIHQSNVLGTVNPIEKIIKRAHEVGAKVLIAEP